MHLKLLFKRSIEGCQLWANAYKQSKLSQKVGNPKLMHLLKHPCVKNTQPY